MGEDFTNINALRTDVYVLQMLYDKRWPWLGKKQEKSVIKSCLIFAMQMTHVQMRSTGSHVVHHSG